MADPFDPDAYVPQAAAALGLPIAPSDLGDVIGSFAVLARVAGVVMGFPLPEELIAGAIFTAETGKA
jgi:Protein of unknown function (DUF4089)